MLSITERINRMRVTVKFDESAGMSPALVKVLQLRDERIREINRKWNDCESISERASEQARRGKFIPLAAVWPAGKDGAK